MGQLGDTLRDRRVALGISIDSAEADTKIRGRLLQALEEGDYSKLPNPGYVRGYISSYARYLELDPIPLLAMYRAETGAGRLHEINVPEQAVATRHEQHAIPWRVALIAAVVVVALAGAGWVAYRAVLGPVATPPLPSTQPTATATGGQAVTPGAPFTIVVKVSDDGASPLKATVDAATAYNGTLTGGQSRTFHVSQSATLRIGQPSRVTVTRDGQKVKLPKSKPAVITLDAEKP